MKTRVCELCNGEASLYCVSDSAFLCWDCDARVHEANFLVARHVRQILCVKCNGFDRDRVSGVGFRPIRSICQSCVSRHVDHSDSSSSCSSSLSDCMSSAESTAAPKRISRNIPLEIGKIAFSRTVTNPKMTKTLASGMKENKKNVDVEAEGILVNWYRRLGLKNTSVVPLALHVTEICLQKLPVLPLRVCLASSLWFSIKSCEPKETTTCQLKRLVQCSGMPAKLFLKVESKLIKIWKKASEEDEQEGWAECSE